MDGMCDGTELLIHVHDPSINASKSESEVGVQGHHEMNLKIPHVIPKGGNDRAMLLLILARCKITSVKSQSPVRRHKHSGRKYHSEDARDISPFVISTVIQRRET
jgi:hypothetical protein